MILNLTHKSQSVVIMDKKQCVETMNDSVHVTVINEA